MQVLICEEPGKLAYKEMDIPAVEAGYSLIRIRRIGICGTDLHAFEGTQPFFYNQRILGHELSGDLVDPNGAAGFIKGEAVTFIPYFNCGECIACRSFKTNCCARIKVCGVHVDGGMVSHMAVPGDSLVHGEGLSYDELALVEPLAIGAHGVRRAAVQSGEYVLVIGAGPIGLGAMEFARIAGGKVIAMDMNKKRLAFCRDQMKVDHIINITTDDVITKLKEITHGEMPTIVIDATGSLKAINNGFHYMAHGARYVLIGLQKGEISFSHPEFHKREATLMSSRNATRSDFEHVIAAMKAGLVDPATYITHRVAFESIRDEFKTWLDPINGVIKAMVTVD
jgi:2-desacetyl-2-hydroxyethyl bacteriochlorophyllide A dehydrogenase